MDIHAIMHALIERETSIPTGRLHDAASRLATIVASREAQKAGIASPDFKREAGWLTAAAREVTGHLKPSATLDGIASGPTLVNQGLGEPTMPALHFLFEATPRIERLTASYQRLSEPEPASFLGRISRALIRTGDNLTLKGAQLHQRQNGVPMKDLEIRRPYSGWLADELASLAEDMRTLRDETLEAAGMPRLGRAMAPRTGRSVSR